MKKQVFIVSAGHPHLVRLVMAQRSDKKVTTEFNSVIDLRAPTGHPFMPLCGTPISQAGFYFLERTADFSHYEKIASLVAEDPHKAVILVVDQVFLNEILRDERLVNFVEVLCEDSQVHYFNVPVPSQQVTYIFADTYSQPAVPVDCVYRSAFQN